MAKPPLFWITFWLVIEGLAGLGCVLVGWALTAWLFGLSAGFLGGMLLWRRSLREIWEDQHARGLR